MRLSTFWRWSARGGVLLIVLGVALVWFVTSDLALRWLTERAVDAAGGRLTIEQTERFGMGGLRFSRIRYTDGQLTVEANAVVVLLSPRSLLRGYPVVRKLTVNDLRVRTSASKEPVRPPASLALPFEGRIDALEIERIVIERAESEIQLGPLALALDYGGGRYRLDVTRLAVPGAAVSGELYLEHSPPYALTSEIRIVPRAQAWSSFAIALSGRMDAIGAGAVGEVYGAEVRAQALLTPFAPDYAAIVRIHAGVFDPQHIVSGVPHARLSIESQASIDSAGRVSGRMQIRNADAGLPAQGKLPIVAVTAVLRGSGHTWSLSELEIDGGRAGHLRGSAQWHDEEASADLVARALDLQALHPRVHRTALSGPLRLRGMRDRLEFTADLVQPGLRAAVEGHLDRERVTLRAARFEGQPGLLTAQGSIELRAPHRYSAAGEVRGFDPARIGQFPAARINAQWRGDGALAPPTAAVAWTIADSSYRGQPVTGTGKLDWSPDRVSGLDLTLAIGAARASARGDFGAIGDRLAWTVDVPELQSVQSDTAGRLRASGVLGDRWMAPALELQAEGTGLRWRDRLRLDRLEARAVLAQGMAGRFDASAQVQKLAWGTQALDHVRMTVAGTRGRHDVRIDAASGKSRVEARLSGGLQEALVWSGVIAAFDLRGPVAASTTQAVQLAVSRGSVEVGPAIVRWGRGEIDMAYLRLHDDGRMSSRGKVSGIALSSLAPVLAVPEGLRALVVGGEWSIAAGASIDGRVSLWREDGDIVINGTPRIAADLRTLRLEARARDAAIEFDAELEAGALGTAHAHGTSRAERRGSVWGIAGDAPVSVQARARMPTLAWARPLIGDGLVMDGAVDLDLRVGGSWARPAYAGDLTATGMRVAVPEYGLALSNGDLRARFDGQRMEIMSLRFSGGEGMLEGRGQVDLARGKVAARVDLTAQKLAIVSSPDRLLVVSGKGGVDWSKSELRARGEWIADRGAIELPREDVPRPSSDVIVLKREAVSEREIGVRADLRLDLGNNFVVRGRGMDARLVGAVRAQLAPKTRPSVTGTVRAAGGTYAAFGQTLAIERAALTFVGPPDNPALDILAMRKNLTVEVGVAVGGTALLPQVRLVSNPAMSDADKLAWLTLGHGLNQAGGNEAAVLQAAALALLSRNDNASGFTGSLASRFGLDELSLGAQSVTGERVVTLGKRFASNVYLGFERGVTGAVSVVKITYDLSRRWSVQARAGTENAVDLFYTLGFR